MNNSPYLVSSAEDARRAPDRMLICFSHLRWNFVFQRPQQLMTRLAARYRVFFWEEAIMDAAGAPWLGRTRCPDSGVTVLVPHLDPADPGHVHEAQLRRLLDELVAAEGLGGRPQARHGQLVCCYYTPMMLGFSRHLAPDATVYDCMDELANFDFAPDGLLDLEAELLDRADLVTTGGYSLYEAKRGRNANVHPFPSSVDRAHFGAARLAGAEPADQACLPGPRLGFYGVIDERLDLALIDAVAAARPDWTLVMIGPVAKIDPALLPRRPNIVWLGARAYADLPAYLSGWDVALMPFAINAATRFISPTKTPEYLAAGRPVVSTPIADVVRHYGDLDGVAIAGDADAFVAACAAQLALGRGEGDWLAPVDRLLATMSWDATASAIAARIEDAARAGKARRAGAQRPHYDVLVVGAGFAGAVMAERLAADGGKRVLVIDRRPHVAGNAYDRTDDAGILIHQYGPHIFHTNSDDVFAYLSRFTEWRPYEHRVLAAVGAQLVPMPINRTTLNLLYGAGLESDADAEAFLAARAEPVADIRNAADMVVARVGRELYETFFRDYTAKQWGIDPSELDKSVTARVPTRTSTDDRYFTDRHQAMPRHGYTRMFERMLSHPRIEVRLGVDFADIREAVDFDLLVFTGPIDEYFGYRHGRLPYRSLEFRHETHDREWVQGVGVVNYPAADTPYTRITEYKHLTGQAAPVTSISYEYPSASGDPYYPIPRPENQALFKRYEALALAEPGVVFVGRLATYRYYNMDQVVGQALAAYRRLAEAPRGARADRKPVAATAGERPVMFTGSDRTPAGSAAAPPHRDAVTPAE